MKDTPVILWCERVIKCCFFAYIYFVPISIAIIEILSGIIITAYVTKYTCVFFQRKDRPQPGYPWRLHEIFTGPITLFLLMNLLAVFFSQYPLVSLRAFFGKIVQEVFLFVAFVDVFYREKDFRMFFAVFFVSFALININGAAQYFWGKGFIFGHVLQDGRVNSSLRHANDFGAYLIVVIPVVLNFFHAAIFDKRFVVKNRVWFSGFLLVLLVCGLASLGLTYSRGAWLAFIAAVVFWATFNPRVIPWGGILIGIFLAVFSPLLNNVRNLRFLADGLGSGRIYFWQEAWGMIRDYPLFGTGLGTYAKFVPVYKVNFKTYSQTMYAHNGYLQMAAEIGIFGLAAFLWFVRTVFYYWRKKMKMIKGTYFQFALEGTCVGLFAFLFHSIFDTQFSSVQLSSYLWVVMGLVVALVKTGTSPERLRGEPEKMCA